MEFLSYFIFLLGISLSVKTYFYETGHQMANRFLAAFLFGSSILLFEVVHYLTCNSPIIAALTLGGLHQVLLVLGPFAYLYVRGTLRDDARLKPVEFLHFVPFIVILMGNIPHIFASWEEKLRIANILCSRVWGDFTAIRLNFIAPYKYLEFFRIVSLLAYGAAQWMLLLKYRKPYNLQDASNVQYIMVRRWLVIFVVLYSIMAAHRGVLGVFLMFLKDWKTLDEIALIACLSLSVFYLIMNFGVFVFNNLLNGLMITPVGILEKNSVPATSEIHLFAQNEAHEEPVQSWYKTLFQPEYLEEIGRLLHIWSDQKKYLGRANLSDISEDTGIPSHHLTYYFNNILGQKFTDWRNALRITHAKALIDDGIMGTLNQEGLANSCGYSSRTAFSRVFKETTGLSPSEYNESKKKEEFPLKPE